MRTLFRWLFRFVILVIVLVVALVLCKDQIIRSVMEKRIRDATGLDAKIGKLEVNVFSSVINIEGFKLYNTAAYGGSPFIEMPELHIEWNSDALRSRRLKLKLVRLHLSEINIVQGQDGKTNLQALQDTLKQQSPTGQSSLEFGGLDTLNLTLGKIRYIHLSQPNAPREVQLSVQNHIINNLRTEKELQQALMTLLLRRGLNLFLPGV